MTRYQLRGPDEAQIAEGSFRSADEARAWPLEQDVAPGWTLLRYDGDQWVTVRRDSSERPATHAS